MNKKMFSTTVFFLLIMTTFPFVAKADDTETTEVPVGVDPLYVCDAGVKICDGNTIKQCNPEGSGYVTLETCEQMYYCAYENGKPVCKEVDHGGLGTGMVVLVGLVIVLVLVILFMKTRKK